MLVRRCSVLMRLVVVVTISGFLLYNSEAYAPPLGRKEIAGMWHLTLKDSFLLKQSDEHKTTTPEEEEEGVLLMLKENGSFVQYGAKQTVKKKNGNMREWLQQAQASGSDGNIEKYDGEKNQNSPLLRGSWDYDMNEQKLLLAADRPLGTDHQRVHDTLLTGKVTVNAVTSLSNDDDAHSLLLSEDSRDVQEKNTQDYYLTIAKGSVWVGRFMYPRNHPSFFEQPMFHPDETGTFVFRQILGKLNTSRDNKEQKKKVTRYHKSDFYGRKFLLTTLPLKPIKPRPKLVWSRTAGGYVEESTTLEDPPFDVRVMPVQFFANNTFSAFGINKILRGRYGTTGDEKEKLWFSVSLFGAGRSVKGSIFSEGRGLSHDDKRTYLGHVSVMGSDEGIERDMSSDESDTDPTKKKLWVEGCVTYGPDFESISRPHSIGTFIMREICEEEN